MSRSLKSMILVVLMFAHAVSDLQTNISISDSNSTTSLPKDLDDEESGSSSEPNQESFNNPSGPKDPKGPSGHVEGDPSEKQKKNQPKPSNAQLSSISDSTPSDIHVHQSEWNDTPDIEDDLTQNIWMKISDDEDLVRVFTILIIFIPSFYTLVFIISVPLNICAVLVFVRRVKTKNAAQIFMLNLACADLLFAAVLPFKIAYRFNGNNWIFGSAMCRLVTVAFFWNMYCSVLLIACMSVDRFFAVVYPVYSLSWRSPRKAVIVCVAMWVLSFAGSMPLLFHEQTFRLEWLDITTCHDLQPYDLIEFYKTYFITLGCLLFFLPLTITAFSYTQVIITLCKAQTGVTDDRRRRRAVVLASTVLVMFVICFTPTNCLNIVNLMNFDFGHIYRVYPLFQCLGSLNCLLDPLVYYFGSSKFQKELCRMLGCRKTT